jgi:hypothetical protein
MRILMLGIASLALAAPPALAQQPPGPYPTSAVSQQTEPGRYRPDKTSGSNCEYGIDSSYLRAGIFEPGLAQAVHELVDQALRHVVQAKGAPRGAFAKVGSSASRASFWWPSLARHTLEWL